MTGSRMSHATPSASLDFGRLARRMLGCPRCPPKYSAEPHLKNSIVRSATPRWMSPSAPKGDIAPFLEPVIPCVGRGLLQSSRDIMSLRKTKSDKSLAPATVACPPSSPAPAGGFCLAKVRRRRVSSGIRAVRPAHAGSARRALCRSRVVAQATGPNNRPRKPVAL
jgi:hypothetical protein